MEHGREGEEELREKRTNQTGDKHGGWRMKRALVCGAGGFIGGDPENFGLRIADCGFEVLLWDSCSTSAKLRAGCGPRKADDANTPR